MNTLFGHLGLIFLMLIMSTLLQVSWQMGGGGGGSSQSEENTYNFTNVRLVNGPLGSPNSGRVEVQLNSTWLDVCDMDWGHKDGIVACRQLGYPGYSRTRRESHFGQGINTGSVDRFDCEEEEISLANCPLKKEPSADMGCGGKNGAGLVCTQPGYVGCYMDNNNNRVFGGSLLSSNSMNISTCINHCREMDGMELAGLQARTECYCGGADTALGTRHNDNDCREECSGNSDEACGGKNLRLSVYNVTLGFCTDPGFPSNGESYPTGESYPFGGVVYFDCDDRFELIGAPSTQCVLGDSPDEVKWSDPLPSCQVGPAEEPMHSGEPTTPVVTTTEMTTRELEATTSRVTTPTEAPDPASTSAMRTRAEAATLEPEVTSDRETGPASPVVAAARTTPQSPSPAGRSGSQAGKFVGLALGCILFIVCACLIVVCLLKRAKRKRDQNGIRASIPLSRSAGRNSLAHADSQEKDSIPMKQLEKSEAAYTALNLSPARKEGDLEGGAGTKKDTPNLGKQNELVNPLYLGGEPNSPSKMSAIRPESNGPTTDGTDYFTVEEEESSLGRAQYSTGVVGAKTPPQLKKTFLQVSDLTQEDADIDYHYYSSANPPNTPTVQNKDSISDPVEEEDDLYTYADPPELVNGGTGRHWDEVKSPDTGYFAIEESGNSMGIPVYGEGENGASRKYQPNAPSKDEAGGRNKRGSDRDENDEYAYADPAGLGEGWVENTMYASGP